MAAPKEHRFHTLAWREVEEADVWYLSRDYDTSVDFLRDLDAALEAISGAPRRWPKYLHGTRRLVMQRFPFSVVYLDDPELVTIIAIAHAKRKPGYWKKRL
jgi:plasmid stabilization system protein ParE